MHAIWAKNGPRKRPMQYIRTDMQKDDYFYSCEHTTYSLIILHPRAEYTPFIISISSFVR